MAAGAVVLLDDPPAFLDITPRICRTVFVNFGKGTFLAAKKERGKRANLFLLEMRVRHAQLLGLDGLHLSLVVDIRLREFVLEEAFVVVPRTLGRTIGQALQVFLIGDG